VGEKQEETFKKTPGVRKLTSMTQLTLSTLITCPQATGGRTVEPQIHIGSGLIVFVGDTNCKRDRNPWA